MLFTSVGLGWFWDVASDIVWIALLIESLLVRCLKIVVNQTALFLFLKSEVMALELRSHVQVIHHLLLLIALILAILLTVAISSTSGENWLFVHVLRLGFWCYCCVVLSSTLFCTDLKARIVFLIASVAITDTDGDLRTHLPWKSSFILRGVDCFGLTHTRVFFRVSEAKLCFGHTSFEFLSTFLSIQRYLYTVHIICLISWANLIIIISKTEISLSKVLVWAHLLRWFDEKGGLWCYLVHRALIPIII